MVVFAIVCYIIIVALAVEAADWKMKYENINKLYQQEKDKYQ